MKNDESALHGLLAEFADGDALIAAIHAARKAGYRAMDAFSPIPLEGLSEAIGFTRDRVPLVTILGGALGGFTGYFMQWYANVVDYPINIGGRPLHSWPAFIPVTFELTVLGAALSAGIGMLLLNGLPRPFHPVFTQKVFERASKDRFFLCIESNDPLFELEHTQAFLRSLRSESVCEVADE